MLQPSEIGASAQTCCARLELSFGDRKTTTTSSCGTRIHTHTHTLHTHHPLIILWRRLREKSNNDTCGESCATKSNTSSSAPSIRSAYLRVASCVYTKLSEPANVCARGASLSSINLTRCTDAAAPRNYLCARAIHT